MTILAAVAPERETRAYAAKHHAECRSIRKVLERLGVQRGVRTVKLTGESRPYAADRAISIREAFDKMVGALRTGETLRPGDSATSRGRLCTVIDIDHEADTCTLAFEVAGIKLTRSYNCIYNGPRR